MKFCVLGGGSKGNATYVEAGDTRILIDAGFSGIEIDRRLKAIGVDSHGLSAVLITHEHTDHTRGIRVLARKKGVAVLANPPTALATLNGECAGVRVCEFGTGEPFVFQDLHIHPFSVSHDAADPVGFHITDGRWSLGYCTDTGLVSRVMRHRLQGCHALILESNHDPGMLREGPYPAYLQQRVLSKTGHLANRDAAALLADLLHEGLRHVVLSHISETNNSHAMVNTAIAEMFKERAESGNVSGTIRPDVSLALQDRVGEYIQLSGEYW